MGSAYCVERTIRNSIEVGTTLLPPNRKCGGGKGEMFIVETLSRGGIRLSVGKKNSKINFTWNELEGVVPYMKELGGQIRIGAVKASTGSLGSLDGYLKRNSQTMRSSYAASILHKAGIVEIHCGGPMSISLRDKYRRCGEVNTPWT